MDFGGASPEILAILATMVGALAFALRSDAQRRNALVDMRASQQRFQQEQEKKREDQQRAFEEKFLKDYDALKKQNLALQEAITVHLEFRTKAEVEAQFLSREIASTRDDFKSLQAQMFANTEKLGHSAATVERLQSDNVALQAKIETLQRQLAVEEKKSESLQIERNELIKLLKEREEEIQSLRDSLRVVTGRLDVLEGENKRLLDLVSTKQDTPVSEESKENIA